MSTEIFYFSGTGNSLFAARELQKRLPGSRMVPIAGLMGKDRIVSTAETVGFVFPVHALTIPIVVRKFIGKLEIKGGEYVFAVATREGTVFRGFEKMDRLLKRKKRRLNSQFILCMHNNDTRHGEPGKKYVPPTREEIIEREKVVLEQLEKIQGIVNSKTVSLEKDTSYTLKTSSNPIFAFLIEKLVIFLMNIADLFGGVNYFYHDEKCTGCGICEKVCLSGKIGMKDKKPVWKRDVLCTMCFACLNFCPQESVQIEDIPGVKSYSQVNGRYNHPYATVNDMVNQKKG